VGHETSANCKVRTALGKKKKKKFDNGEKGGEAIVLEERCEPSGKAD